MAVTSKSPDSMAGTPKSRRVSHRQLSTPTALRKSPSIRRTSRSSTGDSNRSLHLNIHNFPAVDDKTYAGGKPENPQDDHAVKVGRVLRQCLLIMGAYIFGVKQPEHLYLVSKLSEYIFVAWLTCVVIRVTSWFQSKQAMDTSSRTLPVEHSPDSKASPKVPENSEFIRDITVPLADAESVASVDEVEPVLNKSRTMDDSPTTYPLEHLYIIDANNNSRINPNHEPYSLDNNLMTGQMLAMIRTPDVDDPSLQECSKYAKFFRGKQRRFEFQFQFRLKRVPKGRVFFACELEEPVKIGIVQRAFVGAAMAFVRTTNKTFHYSITGSKESPDGKYELPHMAFPIEEGMNRIIITRDGEPVPLLGSTLEENEEDRVRRKKGGRLVPELGVTYTMSLWSAYCDYLQWKCLNLPGIRPFKLTSVVGTQPLRITLYDLPESADKHYRKDVNPVIELELSNTKASSLGRSARKWIKSQNTTPKLSNRLQFADEDLQRDPVLEDTMEEENQYEYEEEAAAELGQGIYVKSGDTLILQESSSSGTSSADSSCFLSNGGGFAVLQEQSSLAVVVEKVGRRTRSRKKALHRGAELIRSGDTVRFRLVEDDLKSTDGTEGKYLTIHRGWWLKWSSSSAAFKTGNFVIHTHETEFSVGEGEIRSQETQSSYLTIGGSFWLGHKRWSKFLVGVSGDESATYGGRMLGLYCRKDGQEQICDDAVFSDEGECLTDFDQHTVGKAGRGKGDWMRPLQLRAYESFSSTVSPCLTNNTDADNRSVDEEEDEERNIIFSSEDHRVDVPVWLEMMNRTDRVRHLLYAVRVLPPEESSVSDGDMKTETRAFCRLRSGSDLSELVRIGLNWRNLEIQEREDSLASPTKSDPEMIPYSPTSFEGIDVPFEFSGDSDNSSWEAEEDGISVDTDDDVEGLEGAGSIRKRKKSRQLIGKIAKSVKRRSTTTGKGVVRRSVKFGKGTVSVGRKAIIASGVSAGKVIRAPIRSKNPPANEPKTRKPGEKRQRKRQERDLHSALSRSMRKIGFPEPTTTDSPSFLAGELSAAEQSCRTVSNILSSVSNVSPDSPFFGSFTEILANQMLYRTRHDVTFLQGDAVQLGVVIRDRSDQGRCVHGTVVARCLWESHWREEWSCLYEHGISMYVPLSNMPCLDISYEDIRSVRALEILHTSPLPGFPMLVVETAWQCHYLVFSDVTTRTIFQDKMVELKGISGELEESSSSMIDKELSKARFWQGFQSSVEASMSSNKDKWANVLVGKRSRRRVVLNRRRMDFDIEQLGTCTRSLVEELLAASLSFSLDSLTANPDTIVRFLDSTSYLRTLSLCDFDLDSKETLCVFVNIYHCLLQHALLLSVNGPLNKRTCDFIMRTSCYEIGGDVFSLAEIESIITGKLSKPNAPKPPFVDVPKKSRSYRFYSLGYTTNTVHFCLNRGHVSSPREVPILQPDLLDEKLDEIAAAYIAQNTTIDALKKTILLPKLCEVYKHDFDSVLDFCIDFLDEASVAEIRLLQQDANLTIKYQSAIDQYHSYLRSD